MDFLDAENPEAAERRLRRRLEREEARRNRRRKMTITGVAVGSVFIAALVFALAGRPAPVDAAKQPAETASQPASVRADVEVVEAEPAVTSEPEPPAPEAAAEPKREVAEPEAEAKAATKPAAKKPSAQKVSIGIGGAGYDPSSVRVDAGRPVRITVAQGEGCAAGFYMPELGVEKDNSAGPVTFTLDALDPGTYTYTCGMGMVSGQLIAE